MEISVSDAKAQLTELVRRAEAGEEIVLTRHGAPAARIVPARKPVDMEARRAGLEELRRTAPPRDPDAPSAARSQDYLYDEIGAPK